jgi:capsular polysaccharide biosynthesis protein
VPRLFLSRMFENLFRRRWLFVLPIVLFVTLGAVSVLGTKTSYRSTGVVLVNRQTLLGVLNSSGANDAIGGDTPALYTSRQINTVLATDQFLDLVIESAQLTSAVESGAVTRQDVRSAIFATGRGDELVSVGAVTSQPELSFRLATATIASYKDWLVNNTLADSDSAVAALTAQIAIQQNAVDGLRGGDPTAIQQAEDKLAELKKNLETAKQVGTSSEAEFSQRLRVLDDPVQPTAPESSRKKDAQTLVLFFALGVLVSGAALVVVTLMDRSVRYDEEIETRLNVPVLTTIPDSPASLKPLAV